MLMDEGLDTGDMLLKKATPIDPEEDASSLHDRLAIMGADALDETVELLVAGKLTSEKQDNALSCYAPLLKKEDGLIDWSTGPLAIKNLVRGMNPWPGAFTWLDDRLVKVFRVRTGQGCGEAGTVLAADRDGIEVACNGGSVILEEIQLEGKKRLPVRDFLAGCRITADTVLGKEV